MLQSAKDAAEYMESGPSLLGPGWREVQSFEDVSDEDEYTSDEEELYAVLNFGQAIDRQTLQIESTYQLIGIDTPVPFLKLGNQVFQGEMAPLIGDEVILGMVRNPANPAKPSHPPIHTSSHHLSFRPIMLYPKGQAGHNIAGPSNSGRASDGIQPVRLPMGRPKGSTSKPKINVQSEEEVKELDLGTLPDNITIEVQAPPESEGAAPGEIVRLSKAQAERLKIGLPLKGRGSRGGLQPVGSKVYISQAGRRARERGEGEEGEETPGVQEVTKSPGEAEGSTSTVKDKGKGKGRGRKANSTETPIPAEDEKDGEEDKRPPDIQMGGLYLTAHDPSNPEPKARKKYKQQGKIKVGGDERRLPSIRAKKAVRTDEAVQTPDRDVAGAGGVGGPGIGGERGEGEEAQDQVREEDMEVPASQLMEIGSDDNI